MNIRVDLNYPIKDGTEVVFRSPVDCSQVTGLKVYYDNGNASQEFVFADAHGNNVGDIDHLFAENVAVKVILDVTTGMAFVQNADTNAYLEGRFGDIEAALGGGATFTTLWRGLANKDTGVTLNDSFLNYKYIIVIACISGQKMYQTSGIFSTADIDLSGGTAQLYLATPFEANASGTITAMASAVLNLYTNPQPNYAILTSASINWQPCALCAVIGVS